MPGKGFFFFFFFCIRPGPAGVGVWQRAGVGRRSVGRLKEPYPTPAARRYGEKMGKMVRGSEATYEELFSYACPKFVTCAPPNLDAPTANTNQARLLSCVKAPLCVSQHCGRHRRPRHLRYFGQLGRA